MKLREYEGKELFAKYNIPVPKGILVSDLRRIKLFSPEIVLKAQTLSGDRKKAGGILFANSAKSAAVSAKHLLGSVLSGETVGLVLIEECIKPEAEYYLSFCYDTAKKGPVFLFSQSGGSGISKAVVAPINIVSGIEPYRSRDMLKGFGVDSQDLVPLSKVIQNLWRLFINEYALLAEINPLFKTKSGEFIAGDAKIILDDEKVDPGKRRFIELPGDIAILASGGGASLLNIDTLMACGGHPANYTEYSGNPPREAVKNLTIKVLCRPGLRGCWVIGGTANFTDIFETMSGFVDGLLKVKPKPTYPIVIRRDGPRQEEAFAMLKKVAKNKKFNLHLFDSRTTMAQSAKKIVELSYQHR